MNIGMLWYDNDPKTDLETKVHLAATYFQNKYGRKATICYLHPAALDSIPSQAAGLSLRSSKSVLKNHFWLGYEAGNQTNAPVSSHSPVSSKS